MRIGLIVTDLSNTRIGGISRVATEVGKNLVDLGHDVTAFLLRRDDGDVPTEYEGMRLRYVDPFWSVNPDYPVVEFSRKAFRLFLEDNQKQEFQVLQTFNLNAIGLEKYHRELIEKRIPVVMSCFETVGMDIRAKSREFFSLPSVKTLIQILGESYLMAVHERRYLHLADAIITEDENTLRALDEMGIDTGKVTLIPSGVDVDRAQATVAPDLGVPWQDSGPVVGYIGRVDPRKGVQYLIEALPLVRKRFPGVQLVLVGGSRHGYDRVIKQMISRLQLQNSVHVLGRIEGDILPYYKLMDRIVIPSLSEGIPITLGEAMASEVPVVITKLPGVVPFVNPSDLVHWAELGSADSLAEAIVASLEDPQSPQRTGRALEFIKQYSWRAVAERHAEVYDTLVTQGSQSLDH